MVLNQIERAESSALALYRRKATHACTANPQLVEIARWTTGPRKFPGCWDWNSTHISRSHPHSIASVRHTRPTVCTDIFSVDVRFDREGTKLSLVRWALGPDSCIHFPLHSSSSHKIHFHCLSRPGFRITTLQSFQGQRYPH